MNAKSLFNKGRALYDREGFGALAKNGLSFVIHKGASPVLEKIIRAKYGDLVLEYSELESQCTDKKIWRLNEDPSNLREENPKAIVPLQSDNSVEFLGRPIMEGHQPYVAELNNATIAGPTAVPFDQKGRIIGELINPSSDSYNYIIGRNISSAILNSPYNVGTALLRGSPPSHASSLPTATVLYDEWNNYYHTMLQQVTKLRGISRYERSTNNDVRLIIPKNPPSFLVEALDLLGYRDKIHEWDGEPTRVERLVVPSFPEIAPRTVEWLRDQMLNVTEPDSRSPKWVHISRQNSDTRRIKNYGEVKAVLDKYGVVSVACEDLSLREQVRLFRSVDGIIGVHGGGLSNMLWGKDVTVLEIFHDYVYGPFYILADALGHEYAAISGQATGKEERLRNIDADVRVDARELDRRLEKLV